MELKDLHAKQDPIDVPLIFNDDGMATDGFKVLGADSPQYQEVDRAWKVRGVKKAVRRGGRALEATDEGAKELLGQLAKREDEILITCIVGIYGFTKEGKPAELSEETIDEIFTARPTWRAKVLAKIESEAVFTSA